MYVNFFDSDDLALSNHITSFENYIKKIIFLIFLPIHTKLEILDIIMTKI